MSSSQSKSLRIAKKFPFLKSVYFFYNIYVRNFKYLFGGSQFNEEKNILDLFESNYKGTYVDIGCFHPTKYSNTRKMYNLGWSGLNIDLNPITIELFNFKRPKDINICAALSNKIKKTKLYHHHDLSSQNTLSNNHVLWMKKNFGLNTLKTKIIKTKRLDNILKKFKINNIDFLNIDIEGLELEVMSTINFNKLNIKVICIELLDYYEMQKKRKKKILNFLENNKFKVVEKLRENYILKK